MSQARHSQPNLLLDFIIVIVAAALLVLASSFGLEAGHPATKGAGAVYGGLYIVYLGALFLLSYFFCRACYVFTFLQFVCTSFSSPRGRHMALFYFALCFGLGLYLLLTGLGFV
jgi:Na+/H+-dicarboxylate symporter